MQVLEKMDRKKGLIVIALLTGLMFGAYLLQYCDFKGNYEITPSTENAYITLSVRGLKYTELPEEALPVTYATITTVEPNTEVHFRISRIQYVEILGDFFYNVDITIKISGQYTLLTLVNNNRWWADGDIDEYLTLPSPVTRAPVEITVIANGARIGTVSQLFEILIYLVEP